ncbi:hypothetical protein FQZ97_1229700 [compost metagenome]
MGEQVALLSFQHLEVLGKDLALTYTDGFSQFLVFRLEVASHAPEVPDRGVGLRCNEVDDDAACLVLGAGLVPTLASVSHTDLDQHMTGRGESADLPAIHQYVVRQPITA